MRKISVSKFRPWLILAFLVVEAALAVLIQGSHGIVESAHCYSVVVLAVLSSLAFLSRERERILLILGLFFTLVADFFLVILDDYYSVAVSFFSVVQLAYAARIYFETDSEMRRRVELWVRIAVSLLSVAVPFILLGAKADYLSVICVFYFANLLLNAIFASTHINIKGDWLFAVGLILFCLCDVFVGFSKLGRYFKIERDTFAWWLAHPGFKAAWVFYVPSQALIALSPLWRCRRQARSPSSVSDGV